MNIKHSKYKNTGILFEILTKRITADILQNKTPKALDILKTHFVNTELGKEYKLYETIFKLKNLSEAKANNVITSVLEASKKLNRSQLKREKYNLIKELKQHYSIEELFKTKISNYKQQASLYTLIEISNSTKNPNINQVLNNTDTLLEHLTTPLSEEKSKVSILEEFKNSDKDLRILTYKILLERFNKKYEGLNQKQKQILKEYITVVDSTPKLKDLYNTEIVEIRNTIKKSLPKIENDAVKVKLNEILKFTDELGKNCKVKNEHILNLLQYHNLLGEIKKIHG